MVGSHFLWESWFSNVSSAAQTDWSLAACWVFSLCSGSTLGGWVGCPSLRGRGRFQEHYLHLIVCVRSSLTEILETPQVSSALRPWPKTTRWDSLVSLYLFSLFAYTRMCVHSSDPKLTPPSHPCGHLPPPGSHTHYQSPLMASN